MNSNRSCIIIISPSIPVISEIFITLREPSERRLTWTMMLMAEAICWRIARCGIETPESSIIISSRPMAFARAVGVDGSDRAVMAGGHRLQHVEDFGAADLADDDSVGAHPQTILDQVALRDLALALEVGRPGLEPNDVRLLERQFGGILDGDDALVLGNEGRKDS